MTPDATVPSGGPQQRPPPRDGRDRLVAALRRPGGRGQLAAGALLAVVGFAAVVQVQSNNEDATYVGARQSELIDLINSLSLASQRAESEIEQLAQTRSALLSDSEARQTALERARQLADERGILAGTLPAAGPGIRVEIGDESGALGANNLINGIQELRDAGAEGIEINDKVRVVAQTSLRDLEEGGVMIDGVELDAPYVLEAIGSPPTLAGGLQIARGFSYEVERVGGTVDILEVESLEITSVREPVSTEYAEPVPPE
ncbi:hypothetical protein BH18ACT9_BH18ACT9_12620 [soil metagenome]